ncbi:MAG: hypothetical protein WDO69_33600 [Pseudomonadota bacterium]
MSRTFVIEADGNVRDSNDKLVREEHQEVLVPSIEAVPQAVLEVVQSHWPEAAASDISWASDPLKWVGADKLYWSTCAEIDGLVRSAQPGEASDG